MKKILISLMLFSTVIFSKELSFKMRVGDKIYRLSENKPIEFDYKYQDGTSAKKLVKIINTGLENDQFTLEIVDKVTNEKITGTFGKQNIMNWRIIKEGNGKKGGENVFL